MDPAQEQEEKRKEQSDGPPRLFRKWRDRLLAGVLWLFIVYLNTSLFSLFPPPDFILPFFGPELREDRLGLYLLLFLLLVILLGLRSLWFAVYFLAFPVVLAGWLAWWLSKSVVRMTGWQTLILAVLSVVSAAGRMARTKGTAAVLALGILPSCYIVLLIGSYRLLLLIAVAFLVIASLRIVWASFQWVLKPLESLVWITDRLLFYYNKGTKDDIFNVDLSKGENDPKVQDARRKLETAKFLIKSAGWVKKSLVTERSLLVMFLCVLLGALLLTTLNFGFLYFGIQKAEDSHFESLRGGEGLADFCYFSFMVLTTSDLSNLKPTTWTAKLATVVQLVCSFGLVSLLLLAFSTVGELNLQEARSSLDALIKEQEARLTSWEAMLNRPPLEIPADEAPTKG